MDISTIFYIAVPSLIIILFAVPLNNYGPLVVLVPIFALFSIVIILLINFADFLIFQFIAKRIGLNIVLAKDHIVSKDQGSIIKHTKGLYFATGYLAANIYSYVFTRESLSETIDDEMSMAPEKWERILMSINFPFKYNIISTSRNIKNYREQLEAQRGLLEFQLSKESNQPNPNLLVTRELQRKIDVIQTRIDRTSQGERPIISVMYVESTAVGVSEKDANIQLENQLNHLQTVLNAFDLSITRIVGRELHTLFKFNYVLPTPNELTKLFEVQK